jgi:hypothetical protein
MIHSRNRITRRSVLRGLGGVSVGLPFLSAMLRPGRSHAADTTPQRLVIFYSPGGTLLDQWRPSGTETSFTLSDMMSPLNPFIDRLVFVDGVDLNVTELGYGHPHSRGMGGVLTGQPLLNGNFNTNEGTAGFADGPSIDQIIAEQISAGLRFRSLEVSSAWSTGITSGGSPHPGNEINYAGASQPIPPSTDPLNTFDRVFSGVGDDPTVTAQRDWNTSILDIVGGEYRRLSAELGAEDRQKLEAHLNMIEEARQGLTAVVSSDCTPPTTINTTPGYYDDGAAEGISRGDLDGGPDGVRAGVKVPEKGLAMTDILVAALACDVTRVGTMQWGDSEAKFMMPFLTEANGTPLADHHHGYQHDRGFQPEALAVIHKWYAENFAYLLGKLAAVQEGNGLSLLDNSLVMWVTEIQQPGNHGQDNMPFVLAGRAGGSLTTQRWLRVPSQPHNNLLVSVLNMFGVNVNNFGREGYSTGPLAGLV